MPTCEMCGKEGSLILTEIEGTRLNVCSNCSKYGVTSRPSKKVFVKHRKLLPEETEESVVFDFPDRIKQVREKKRMNQEEFAKFLNEKESVVQKWEAGNLKPGLGMAKKLSRMFETNFIQKIEDKEVKIEKSKTGEMTLGDLIKIKRRR